jgi:hypothetical protein
VEATDADQTILTFAQAEQSKMNTCVYSLNATPGALRDAAAAAVDLEGCELREPDTSSKAQESQAATLADIVTDNLMDFTMTARTGYFRRHWPDSRAFPRFSLSRSDSS